MHSDAKKNASLSAGAQSIGVGVADLHPLPLPSGGAGRDRTDGLLLAKQALSQLSYSPGLICVRPFGGSGWIRTIDPRLIKTVL